MDDSRSSSPAAPAHDIHTDTGAGHGSVRSYVIGFALSVLLTAAPFGLVMLRLAPTNVAVPLCIGLGVVQIVVHLIYFLHMNGSSSQYWNMAAFIFTLVILAILVVGSLWVMYHLNANMMPGMMPAD